jgi:GT2 family glycosyltransferase
MQLSVIIVNYNVRPFLENALASALKAMEGIVGEIIVVDNASADGSVEMVERLFPSVKLFPQKKNLGFGAANNIGMKSARGEYFLLLNPDTIVQEDTFRVMIDFFTRHADVGLAGCKVLGSDGLLQPACRRSFPTPWVAFTKIAGLSAVFPQSRLFGKYNLTYLDPDKTYEVDAVSGSFMFLPRTTFEAIGGFDEQFFMYGEDLDLCYRVQQSGKKVYYVHETQIIHYKGESARRSDIDEVKVFYESMRVFVRKHIRRGAVTSGILHLAILLREWLAFFGKAARPLASAVVDLLVIDCSFLLGEYIWFGMIWKFPAYAYPIEMTVPWLIIVGAMYLTGQYSSRRSSSGISWATLMGYLILSALVFFFKQYGFSRMVVLISGGINVIALPGWRVLVRALLHSSDSRRKNVFGRRTLIVGAENAGQELLRKLRARLTEGYDVVGFIDIDQRRIGDSVGGVEILGSIDNISKIVEEQRVSDVIFSTDILSYTEILSVIARTRDRSINYRLVPNSLEALIGKTRIDELNDLPLVEIEYNIHRPLNRFVKRLFDIFWSAILLAILYPFSSKPKKGTESKAFVPRLPRVFRGELSLVGPPENVDGISAGQQPQAYGFLGKPGLTGLVQLNEAGTPAPEDVEKYNMFYAKNQSFWLDCEILMKSVFHTVRS